MVHLQDIGDGRTPELSSSMADSGATVRDLRLGGDDEEEPQEKAKEEEVEPCKNLPIWTNLSFQTFCSVSLCLADLCTGWSIWG